MCTPEEKEERLEANKKKTKEAHQKKQKDRSNIRVIANQTRQ